MGVDNVLIHQEDQEQCAPILKLQVITAQIRTTLLVLTGRSVRRTCKRLKLILIPKTMIMYTLVLELMEVKTTPCVELELVSV